MKKLLFIVISIVLMVSCGDQKRKTGYNERVAAGVDSTEMDTRATEGSVTIHRQWVSEPDDDGTRMLFDLRDEHHYIEAMTFDEAYCKHIGGGAKPGVFYIINEASDYKVELERDDEPTQGSVDYLIEEDGPMRGQYVSRFQFSYLTADSVSLLFEGEFEHTYKALEEPVEVLPNPEKK